MLDCVLLRAVLARFRSEVLKMEVLKREMDRLSSSLTQEQTYTYSSIQQLEQRAILLQNRLHACASSLGMWGRRGEGLGYFLFEIAS